ncbi:hypothetical protein DB346_10325 [Verrucomicrobia bacterium LW23]|nr:hypothetical protein DB346_10325 [Verrucomicrobia bacterium LW23]
MSLITAILVADADGTLHLPIPKELREKRLRVTATVELEESSPVSGSNFLLTSPSAPEAKPITAMVSTPNGMKPDWDEIHRQVYGNDMSKMLSEEDSAFIRDRGDR